MNIVPATIEQIPRGEAVLSEGGVVVIPTDTVYGIAARIDVQSAVDRLFEIKGRDRKRPMAVLVSDLNMARGLAVFSDEALDAATKGWPGALTLVLPRTEEATRFDIGEAETIGLRVPDHSFAVELIGRTGPLVATSANPSGRPEAVTVDDMKADLPGVALFFDAGPIEGRPSKVVSFVDGKKTLRD